MKRFCPISALCIFLQLFIATEMSAHHGKDYFISKSYHTPKGGEWVGLFSTDYIRMKSHGEEESRGFGFEPGVLFGITNRWSLEIHLHIEKQYDDGLHYESTGLEQRFQLTQWDGLRERRVPIDVAGLLEFEKGFSDEHADVIQGGLIFSHDGLDHNITANFLLRKELQAHRKVDLLYSVGAKREISESVGMGVEFNGKLADDVLQQITPGVYFQTGSGLRVKFGVSLGLDGNASDYAIRTSFVLDL